LLAACTSSAVHLEIHDVHLTSDAAYQAWLAGRADPRESAQQYRAYTDVVMPAVRRGVTVRRARIVSEPVSDYVRWEHSLTEPVNIAAGEQVRWLPRRLASTLAVPGNPYWVFDNRLVRFTLFGGDGEVQGNQYSLWVLTAWGSRETRGCRPGAGGHGPACLAVGVLPVRRPAP
jgi:hypothetical protein